MSRWHKCKTKTMNKPQESVIFGSSGNLRHQCPIHHSQLSESGTHCVAWLCHFFVEKQNWRSILFLLASGPIKIWWNINEKMFTETLPVLSTRCSSSGVPLTKENCNSVSKQDLANSSRKGNPFASVPLQVIQQKRTDLYNKGTEPSLAKAKKVTLVCLWNFTALLWFKLRIWYTKLASLTVLHENSPKRVNPGIFHTGVTLYRPSPTVKERSKGHTTECSISSRVYRASIEERHYTGHEVLW